MENSLPACDPQDLKTWRTCELLSMYGRIMTELQERRVVRTANNPVADYSEHLAAKALGLELMANSKAGYDAVDESGNRYQIKGRRIGPKSGSVMLGVCRNLDKRPFDFLIGIVFGADFSVLRACQMPLAVVLEHASHREYVNGWVLCLREAMWQMPGVQDLTMELQEAQALEDDRRGRG